MVPSDAVGLAILLLAVVPGFIAVGAWSRTKTWKGRGTDFLTVVQSVVVSAVIQVCASPLTLWLVYPYRKDLDRYPGNVIVWLALVVLVIPYSGGTLIARAANILPFQPTGLWKQARSIAQWIQPAAPPPTMWDWLFSLNIADGAWVTLTYNDGSRVAGFFGADDARKGYALTSPQKQGLYLPEEWLLDARGWLVAAVPNSSGILIPDIANVRSIRIQRRQEPAEASKASSQPS